MNTYDDMNIYVGLGIDQIANRTAIDLGTLIQQMKASGMNEATIMGSIMNDLQNNGAIFAQFRNGIKNVTQDGVRMAGGIASTKTYVEAGVKEYVWVTSGGKVCRDCSPRHGEKGTDEYFTMIGKPGTGWSVCQAHCQCILEPANFKGVPRKPIVRKPVPKAKATNPLDFKMAGKHKSVADSIAWMKQHIAHKVTLGQMKDLTLANKLTETLAVLKSKYRFHKLDEIKHSTGGSWASAHGRTLRFNKRTLTRKGLDGYYEGSVLTFRSKWLGYIDEYKAMIKKVTQADGTIDPIYNNWMKSTMATIRKYERKIAKIDEYGWKRHNALTRGKELRDIITHELGHVIHDQYTGAINSTWALRSGLSGAERLLLNDKWLDIFNTVTATKGRKVHLKSTFDLTTESYKSVSALGTNEARVVSQYAYKNHKELFAESFAMYNNSMRKDLPKIIRDYFDEYLQIKEMMGGS